MLKWETVSAGLKKTLTALMRTQILNDHRLVGGTALSLQLGHRYSVDIDLFNDTKKTDYELLHQQLHQQFQNHYTIVSKTDNGIRCEINDIKVDIIDWNERWIRDEVSIEGVRLAAKEDIVALKLNTLCSDLNILHPMKPRYDKKDFIDLAVLSDSFSIDHFFLFYKLKYPTSNIDERILLERMGKFDMAENSEMPKMMIPLTWEATKLKLNNVIIKHIQNESR